VNTAAATNQSDESAIERYYRFHAGVYDLTRWAFLFGRSELLRRAGADNPARVLEVGCGTGRNLTELATRAPRAHVTGVDLSAAMLERSGQRVKPLGDRVQLVHRDYSQPLGTLPVFDLVVFSYSLSMFNPGFDLAIEAAWHDLLPGGRIAVVDFHDCPAPVERWFSFNHVRANRQLRPLLEDRFEAEYNQTRAAFGGTWRYLMFVGKKR
jgi:S-adenosylmethionine-diacylgycerolhomoserine-N-methlytransferase